METIRTFLETLILKGPRVHRRVRHKRDLNVTVSRLIEEPQFRKALIRVLTLIHIAIGIQEESFMQENWKFSTILVGSLMLLAAFAPALAVSGSTTMSPAFLSSSTGSYNWGGYAVTGAAGSVSSVSASWTVPSTTASTNIPVDPSFSRTSTSSLTSSLTMPPGYHPTPPSRPSSVYYAAFWVGIDGFNSNTVEQTGILAEASGSTTSYIAWYEFYPSEAIIQITAATSPSGKTATVSPGDSISASVTYSAGQFTLSITDNTAGWTYSTTGTQSGAKESSAECIVETPSVNGRLASLADFGTATFSSFDATIAPSTTPEPIGSFSSSSNCNAITMYNYPMATTVMASPSSITSSSIGFSVTWENSGP